MRVLRGNFQLEPELGRSAVTIGKFDGVHLGHREIMQRLVSVAAEQGLTSVALTFDRNPLYVLHPEVAPVGLCSLEQKLALLDGTGVDVAAVINFNSEFAGLEAEEFLREVLVRQLRTKVVLVGSDFRFGTKARGDVDMLRSLGAEHDFEVLLIEDVAADGQARVSTSRIRELLDAGDVTHAARLLGRLHAVRGEVVHGAKRGRALGFPTANLCAQPEGMIPADGVYAGWFWVDGKRHPAAVSVGDNPTFVGVSPKQVEAFIPGEEFDVYGKIATIEFVERVRGMVAYAGVEPLIAQMHEDVARVREILRA